MAKYVARVRKDANSYRYFYSPAEYQAYLKAAGRASAKFATNATATAAKAGKKLGENAARLATNLTGAASAAQKKVHKYVYNKNAAKKLDEMGKAHELDERSRQNAQKLATPRTTNDEGTRRNRRSLMDMKSTVNRRAEEAVLGGTVKKKDGKYVHVDPKPTGTHYSSPDVGKMTDAATKALQDQQRQKDSAKAFKAKKQKEAYEKNAAGKAGDAAALAESIKQKHAKTQASAPYEKNASGKAADAAAKAKEAKARQTQQHMNKALDDRGAEVEMEVRRRRYNERQLGIEDKPKYYKPSSSELLAEFNNKQEKKKIAKKIAEGVENGEKRAEGYAQEAAYKQKRDESRRNMKEWNYEKSKVVSVKDTEERMKKKKYVK